MADILGHVNRTREVFRQIARELPYADSAGGVLEVFSREDRRVYVGTILLALAFLIEVASSR
jgi:hypothetical protein